MESWQERSEGTSFKAQTGGGTSRGALSDCDLRRQELRRGVSREGREKEHGVIPTSVLQGDPDPPLSGMLQQQ